MKRFTIMAAIIAIAFFAASATGMEMKGRVLIGGYAGYGIGLGDDFKEYTSAFPFWTVTRQLKPGLAFGGKLCYGIGSAFLIGGQVGFQRMKSKELMVETNDPMFTDDRSTTDTWIAVNANVIYLFPTKGSLRPYFEAGPGLYFDPDDEGGGFDAGLGGIYSVSQNVVLDVGARLHTIVGMDVLTYVELHGGISVVLGGVK